MNRFFKESALIFFSSGLMNLFNLVFWLFMVRALDTAEYGVLNSVIALAMFFSIPLGVIQMVTTRSISRLRAQSKEGEAAHLFWLFLRFVGIFLTVILIFIFFGTPSLSRFLHIQNAFIYAVAASLVFSSLSGVTLGVLMGLQEFGAVAFNNVATGLTKLAVGCLLVFAGIKAFGAFLGFVSSFAVTFGLSWARLPSWMRKKDEGVGGPKIDTKEVVSNFLPTTLGTLCFFALTNIDVILVKHFFSPAEAGYYSVGQMVGKIVLFISGAVGVVMFPKVIEAHSRAIDPRPLLKKCLLFVGFLSGISALISCVVPGFILKLLTGHQSPEVLPLVRFFALSMGLFALVNVLMLYHISLNRLGFLCVLAVVAAIEAVLICFFHQTQTGILWILLLSGTVLFLSGAWLSFGGARP